MGRHKMLDGTKKTVFVFALASGDGYTLLPDGTGKGGMIRVPHVKPNDQFAELVEISGEVWEAIKDTAYGKAVKSYTDKNNAEKALKHAKIKFYPRIGMFPDQAAIVAGMKK